MGESWRYQSFTRLVAVSAGARNQKVAPFGSDLYPRSHNKHGLYNCKVIKSLFYMSYRVQYFLF